MREMGTWSTYGRLELSDLVDSRVEITADSYRWVDRELVSWAGSQVLRWNRSTWNDTMPAESSFYDIDVTQLDPEAVQFRGRKTGEIVIRRRIRASTSFAYSGDIQFSSSDPSHPTFVVKEFLEACPDRLPWHGTFLFENFKVLTATRQSRIASTSSLLLPRRLR